MTSDRSGNGRGSVVEREQQQPGDDVELVWISKYIMWKSWEVEEKGKAMKKRTTNNNKS